MVAVICRVMVAVICSVIVSVICRVMGHGGCNLQSHESCVMVAIICNIMVAVICSVMVVVICIFMVAVICRVVVAVICRVKVHGGCILQRHGGCNLESWFMRRQSVLFDCVFPSPHTAMKMAQNDGQSTPRGSCNCSVLMRTAPAQSTISYRNYTRGGAEGGDGKIRKVPVAHKHLAVASDGMKPSCCSLLDY
ncbi:hypothetical protein F7725_024803 [Dissostichus mawsoni]|uniref:Uncharacterized protein n=1 Tax=Dissostichus mawsoni TaxID=36200 RepID=A0A7J5XAA5_DISMA|nr:hypothetical protein F7725_024803 [Dissostichus mawsoni]